MTVYGMISQDVAILLDVYVKLSVVIKKQSSPLKD